MKMLTLIALLAAQSAPPIDVDQDCVIPPYGSTPACVKCYEEACARFAQRFYDCDRDEHCREMAEQTYWFEIYLCECGPNAVAALSALSGQRLMHAAEIVKTWDQTAR